MINKVAEVLVGPTPKITPPQEGRQRTTFNLGNIGKVAKTAEEAPVAKTEERAPDKPINKEILQAAWQELVVLRKNQVAEVTLLKREYSIQGNTIIVPLNNPIEEPLLANMRTSIITFLRDRLGNSSLMVAGELQVSTAPNLPYTNKDKFEHLAEKNPVLKEMKERFGLDPDL